MAGQQQTAIAQQARQHAAQHDVLAEALANEMERAKRVIDMDDEMWLPNNTILSRSVNSPVVK